MSFPSDHDQSRLHLQTMYNIRDLGGFNTKDGRITRFGRFLRADAPTQLNQHDLQLLLDFPVRKVIDLRCPTEIGDQPHGLRTQPAVNYINIPLLGDDLETGIAAVQLFDADQDVVGLADLYVHLLENSKDSIGQVFSHLAAARQGACLFHCTHGKDRTGLVSALLLMLAGVDDSNIIANYQISEIYLEPWFVTFIDKIPENIRQYLNSNAQNMELTLRYFHQHFASAEAYLDGCGVSASEIDEIRNRLLN